MPSISSMIVFAVDVTVASSVAGRAGPSRIVNPSAHPVLAITHGIKNPARDHGLAFMKLAQ
jgi:hypothetical protein